MSAGAPQPLNRNEDPARQGPLVVLCCFHLQHTTPGADPPYKDKACRSAVLDGAPVRAFMLTESNTREWRRQASRRPSQKGDMSWLTK